METGRQMLLRTVILEYKAKWLRIENSLYINIFVFFFLESAMTLTYEEMAAQVWIFLLAGLETSSTTMSFCLYELALNQDIQQKVHEEIDQISRKYSNTITYDSMQELKYLECCLDGKNDDNNLKFTLFYYSI